MTKYYHHPTFVQYKKKSHQFISSLQYEKKINKRKEKKIKEGKKQNWKYLKRKQIKGKKISCWSIGSLLCAIHSAYHKLFLGYSPNSLFFSTKKSKKILELKENK
jgi:hypothetical protein